MKVKYGCPVIKIYSNCDLVTQRQLKITNLQCIGQFEAKKDNITMANHEL